MEKLWLGLIVFCAGVVGLCLFIVGYSRVRSRGKTKSIREFWMAVAIVLAFLTTVFSGYASYSRAEESNKEITSRPQTITPELETKIKDLIQKLGAEDWHVREAATKELIKIGNPISPYLQDALKSEDIEVRLRAKNIWNTTHIFPKLQTVWQELTTLTTQTRIDTAPYELKINQLINQIQQEKNLSDALKLTLKTLASIRLYHIGRTRGMMLVTCYDMSGEGVTRKRTLQDLEQQYRLIENMAKQGKVNQETLAKAKTAIRNDYEALINWETKKSIMDGLLPEEKDRLVDLVIGLCGMETQELKDGRTEEQVKLEETPQWKAIVEWWREVSQLRDDKKTHKELNQIRKETEKKLDALKGLVDKGMISPSLIELIRKDFTEKTEVKPLDTSCYLRKTISPPAKSWSRLKDRLPVLERAYKANRINYWTYKKVIMRLKKDLEILDGAGKEWYKTRSHIKEEEVEALIKRTRKLFDGIEKKVFEVKLSAGDEQKVREWIKQLAVADWKIREKASKSLESLLYQTPAVIPYLKEALKSDDAEVKMRAKRILESFGSDETK